MMAGYIFARGLTEQLNPKTVLSFKVRLIKVAFQAVFLVLVIKGTFSALKIRAMAVTPLPARYRSKILSTVFAAFGTTA